MNLLLFTGGFFPYELAPPMARLWRDGVSRRSNYLPCLTQRINRATQIRRRLMSVNTRHSYRRVTEQVPNIPLVNAIDSQTRP